MKQLLKHPDSGETRVADVPAPMLLPGRVRVRNAASVVSAGTERATVEFSEAGLLGKAMRRPDLVKKVVDKARREGPAAAWSTARTRLAEPLTLGYATAGVVVEVGEGVDDLAVGRRVACAGAGYAVHAEEVCVPRNLVAPVPDGVPLEEAAFTTLGCIALHGVRLAETELDGTVGVVGLGLVGLLVGQVARAAGCRVLGADLDADRVALAAELGLEAVTLEDAEGSAMEAAAAELSGGLGLDAVLIAAATSGSGPIELAGRVARDRGRVIVVGDVGMEIPRDLYYEKELDLRVSRSYGPGRYDSAYEEEGRDYPPGYVRWTENRNMEAFLRLVSRGEVAVEPLISHRISIEEGERAYRLLSGEEPTLGLLITYPGAEEGTTAEPADRRRDLVAPEDSRHAGERSDGVGLSVGLIGAGNFATGTLLPILSEDGRVALAGVCAATGPSAEGVGREHGFRYATTDPEDVLTDPSVDTVVVATPHHLHAGQARRALEAGKHVFCEKPPALDEEELAALLRAALSARGGVGADGEGVDPVLAVDYNRRFSPLTDDLRSFFQDLGEPLVVDYRVNAGTVDLDHWIQDPDRGGGRIVGEVGHFVDFLIRVTGSLPVRVWAAGPPTRPPYRDDNVVLTVETDEGSIGTITYLACGDPSFGKERVEVHGGGRSAVLEDYRRLETRRDGRRNVRRSWLGPEKGHAEAWAAFSAAVRNRQLPPPIPLVELAATSLVTFRVREVLRADRPLSVGAKAFLADLEAGSG